MGRFLVNDDGSDPRNLLRNEDGQVLALGSSNLGTTQAEKSSDKPAKEAQIEVIYVNPQQGK